jgi:hypothetical protein
VPLYGLVYYFHRVKTELDADNLSKPVWDSLVGAAYADDELIRLRIAGVYEVTEMSMEALILDRMPSPLAERLVQLLERHNHVLYVEFGRLNESMYLFGLEPGL